MLPAACWSLVALLCIVPAAVAQSDGDRAAFPPDGWSAAELPPARGPGAGKASVMLREGGELRVRFARPDGWDETIVTDAAGAVLARSADRELTLADRHVGERYVVFAARTAEREYARVAEGFVRYPGAVFPARKWRARPSAQLRCSDVQQHAPVTSPDGGKEAHRITFRVERDEPPAEGDGPAAERAPVYLLARCVAGGKDMVVAQSLTPELPFWVRAKRGESFKIYELFPDDRTYRVSATMTVEHDAPRDR